MKKFFFSFLFLVLISSLNGMDQPLVCSDSMVASSDGQVMLFPASVASQCITLSNALRYTQTGSAFPVPFKATTLQSVIDLGGIIAHEHDPQLRKNLMADYVCRIEDEQSIQLLHALDFLDAEQLFDDCMNSFIDNKVISEDTASRDLYNAFMKFIRPYRYKNNPHFITPAVENRMCKSLLKRFDSSRLFQKTVSKMSHYYAPLATVFSPDGRYLVWRASTAVFVIDTQTNDVVHAVASEVIVSNLVFTDDHSIVYMTFRNVNDVNRRELVLQKISFNQDELVRPYTLSYPLRNLPREGLWGKRLLAVYNNTVYISIEGFLYAYNLDSGELLERFETPDLTSLSVSSDGTVVYSDAIATYIKKVGSLAFTQLYQMSFSVALAIKKITWSPNGKLIAIVRNGSCVIIDKEGTVKKTLTFVKEVHDVAWDDTGFFIAVGNQLLHDEVDTDKLILFYEHQNPAAKLQRIIVSLDGTRLSFSTQLKRSGYNALYHGIINLNLKHQLDFNYLTLDELKVLMKIFEMKRMVGLCAHQKSLIAYWVPFLKGRIKDKEWVGWCDECSKQPSPAKRARLAAAEKES